MSGSWRRSRPFWGGLLVLAAGLELLSIPFATQALPLVIQSGTVGATYLISLVLIILGLMVWLQPDKRAFLGVVAVLISIASFIYANLGGFLIGMLLGLVGGALAVAWTPAETTVAGSAPTQPAAPPGPQEGEITITGRRVVSGDERLGATRPQRPAAEPPGEGPRVLVARVRDGSASEPEDESPGGGPDDGDGPVDGPDDGGVRPDGGGHGGGHGGGRGDGGPGPATRALAIAVLPVILAAGTAVAREDPGPGGQGGSLLPGVVPSAVPSGLSDVLDGVLPSAVPTALPTSLQDAVGSLTGRRSPSPSPGEGGEDEPGGSSTRGGSAPGAVRVATETAAVRAPSLTMTGMKFTGVVEMPTATGTVKMLRFTMDKAVLERPTQTMGPTTLTGSTFTFEGNVVICTTKMTAKLLGLPQEFTAEHPNLLVKALRLVPSLNVPLTMTDIVSEQPYVTADSLRADDLRLVVGA
ncbi:DUF6114 domain-containing protein [Microbispora sp. H10836]|uniref:DUF6114 domain-containing protein n=1 Tax=Microbispora sp. H10836 TaxID=2729106 RepID=UPI0014731C00|nr:DUF6114 domain-containing protein [Microbispora sp. H10836]